MRLSLSGMVAMAALLGPVPCLAGKPVACFSAEQAAQMLNQDICISAHIYDVVQLSDGTRFLDVCPPQVPDEQCRFTVVSFRGDYSSVGTLQKYRNLDVRIRGIVQPMNGRSGMILSHARQFNGGRPKFRPNPVLAGGFDAEESRPPGYDRNLNAEGRHRSFMNARSQETLPAR